MADIAQIGFSADTSELKDAKASLDVLVPAAANVDRAVDNLADSFDHANTSASAANNAVKNFANGATMNASLVAKAASANFSFAGGFDVITGKANSTFAAINKNMSAWNSLGAKTNEVGKGIKFTTQESLNFSRQIADIGVTAAMGMNPLMIAIQQGPQLLDILQMKAAATGVTIGAAFRAAGASIWAALAPLLPFILGIALAVGAMAAAFGLATREINKGNADIISGLGLTEKQLERVKKSGVETGVTIGDTFFAFFDVVGERLTTAFDGPLKWLRDAWNTTIDFIAKVGEWWIKSFIGQFVGAVYAVKASWSTLPGAIGDHAISAANGVIMATEWMINKSIAGLNMLLDMANAAAAKVGLQGLGNLSDVSIGRVNNPFAGQAEQARKAIGTGFKQGMADASGAVDRFFGDVGKRARQRAKDRIIEAAGPGDAAKSGADGAAAGKTDGEKFDDIMKNADAKIAVLKAERDAIGLGTEALARMRFEQDLLNEAAQKGIKLSEPQIQAIKDKADAYGKLTAEIEHLKFMQGVTDKIAADKAAQEQERNELYLTGEALIAYRYEQDLLNQAKARHIELTEAERAAIHESSVEYAANAQAIKRQRDALDNAKEVTRGFFRDIYDNVKQGQSIWDSFANAVTSAIDKIVDKLVNSAIDDLINQIFSSAGGEGGGGGSGDFSQIILSLFASAKGNVFNGGGVQPFAKGGSFTNSVVSQPTLFTFAKGGALGVMGEAGPEAILPLQRGGDGSLGVRVHGGSRSGGAPAVNLTITNNHTITGAVSSSDIIDLNRRTAEQTKSELRRDIPGIIQQFQRDGALS